MQELRSLKGFYQRQIADAIDEHLQYEPTTATRRRKPLDVTEASFTFDPPLWELRIGNFGVFYDVDEKGKIVFVRAVREKPPHAISEEVL